MSSLETRNAEAMMNHLRMVNSKLEENSKLIAAQNQKIATLDQKVAALTKQVVLAAVASGGEL